MAEWPADVFSGAVLAVGSFGGIVKRIVKALPMFGYGP